MNQILLGVLSDGLVDVLGMFCVFMVMSITI